jgi:hypothetical protein
MSNLFDPKGRQGRWFLSMSGQISERWLWITLAWVINGGGITKDY